MDAAKLRIAFETIFDEMKDISQRMAVLEKQVAEIQHWPPYVQPLEDLEARVAALETHKPVHGFGVAAPHLKNAEVRNGKA